MRADSAAGTVELGLESERRYRVAPASASASVAGAVLVRGTLTDSVVPVSVDARVCGDSVVVNPATLGEGSLVGALVWVDGIASGKPLPEARRATLTIQKCRYDPRLLAVVTGTTVNVFSEDPTSHDVRFYREGQQGVVARVRTMDAGQVVPNEEIAARAGMVEARCAQHPWERAWVAVFDHPYFAVTDARGSFTIDALPPGTYTMKAWFEGMDAPIEQRVVVRAAGAGKVDFVLPIGSDTTVNPPAPAGPRPSP